MVGIIDSAQKIVTNGLAINYDPAQLRSYPATGTTVFDLSKNGNNGTLNGGVGFADLFGGCFVFDGADDNISTSYNQIGCNNSTMILWYRWIGTNAFKLLSYIGDSSSGGMGFIQLNNDTVGVLYGGISLSAINNGTAVASLSNGFWTQLAITRDTSTTTLYQDGAYLGHTTNTPAQNTSFLNLSLGGSSFANGGLGTFEFYGRQLSAEEILQNFNANKIRYGF